MGTRCWHALLCSWNCRLQQQQCRREQGPSPPVKGMGSLLSTWPRGTPSGLIFVRTSVTVATRRMRWPTAWPPPRCLQLSPLTYPRAAPQVGNYCIPTSRPTACCSRSLVNPQHVGKFTFRQRVIWQADRDLMVACKAGGHVHSIVFVNGWKACRQGYSLCVIAEGIKSTASSRHVSESMGNHRQDTPFSRRNGRHEGVGYEPGSPGSDSSSGLESPTGHTPRRESRAGEQSKPSTGVPSSTMSTITLPRADVSLYPSHSMQGNLASQTSITFATVLVMYTVSWTAAEKTALDLDFISRVRTN